ncbi:MAG: heme exporter protein CcmD [Caulobacter sp.]|nr:heme exporter protein CcmD [Caulobacter sp.]
MHISFEVGRYGPYIWPAFGLSGLVLAALIGHSLASVRHWRREVERLQSQADAKTK